MKKVKLITGNNKKELRKKFVDAENDDYTYISKEMKVSGKYIQYLAKDI